MWCPECLGSGAQLCKVSSSTPDELEHLGLEQHHPPSTWKAANLEEQPFRKLDGYVATLCKP